MFNDNITIFGNIMVTENYDMFKKIGGNRKLNKANYAKIVKSMKEEQLIIPIVVNEKYEIIDGQHRYTACKDLGKPVYFYMVRGYGLNQVKRANIASSNWKKENYLDMFIAEKNEVYIEFEEIKERYDINISNLLKIFSIVQEKQLARVGYEFENGIFTLDGKMKVLNFLMALEDFNFFKFYKSNNFLIAFTRLYFKSEYDHDKMKTKLITHRNSLEKRSTSDEYLVLLCNRIYSFGVTKNPIYYSSESKKFHQ